MPRIVSLYLCLYLCYRISLVVWPPEAAILFGSCTGPGHDNKLHPHRVLALYDLVVDGPLSNHSINNNKQFDLLVSTSVLFYRLYLCVVHFDMELHQSNSD